MDPKKTPTKNITFKILVLGDSAVGKTSLINQFVNNNFTIKYKATIGVDLSTKIISIDNSIIQLQIWDPSGSERFRSINESFFRGTDGYIMTCSLTSLESFEHFETWINEMETIIGSNVPFVPVANKCDVDEVEWEVTKTKFDTWCSERNIQGFYVSAKDNTNVENAFTILTEKILKDYKPIQNDEPKENVVRIDMSGKMNQNSSCC